MDRDLAERRAALLRKRLASAGFTGEQTGAARIPRRADRSAAPLSPSQRRMWVLHRLDPTGTAYNVCLHLTFSGPLDVPALRAALRGLVVRHEVLRTRYPLGADQLPRQRIDPAPADHEFPVPLLDLRERPPGAVDELVTELAGHRFDLAREWPLRVVLYRTGDAEYHLGLVVHHIAWDGGTWPVISAELSAGYTAASNAGTGASVGAAEPEAPAVQYGDFAAVHAATPARPAERDYWLGQLARLPGPVPLPADRPAQREAGRGGGRRSVHWDAERTRRLTALAAQRRVTPFTVLLAGFGALLHRYSGRTDLPIGRPA